MSIRFGAGHEVQQLIQRGAAALAIGIVLASTLACFDRALEVSAPSKPQLDDSGLDATQMARLRSVGEGCAVSLMDTAGVHRGFAVPRLDLPFSVPPIRRDVSTRTGNGAVRRIQMQRPAGLVTLDCWLPNTLGPDELATALERSQTDKRWDEMLNSLEIARELPVNLEAEPQSAEVVQFESEMLAQRSDPSAGTFYQEGCFFENRGSNPNAARYDCSMECVGWSVTIWFNGDTWSIEFEFYACQSQGGGGYGWLINNNYLQWCTGTAIPNDADVLREQYRVYNAAVIPPCGYFIFEPSTPNFPYNIIRSHDRYYTHAILRGILASALESLYGAIGIIVTEQNRVYSSPAHQAVKSPGNPNGRHIYGDAVDIHSNSGTWQSIRTDASNILDPRPCAEPLNVSGFNHVHLDYRAVPSALNRADGCPPAWELP